MKNIAIENARLLFRNFGGKPTKFRPAGGVREVSVVIPNDIAHDLLVDGWNIKTLRAREDGEDPDRILNVTVSYKFRAPKICIVGKDGTLSKLDETDIDMLDWAEIETCDIIIEPSRYDFNGNTGIKAYLKTLYITLQEDEFEAKYSAIAETSRNESPMEDDGKLPF